MNEAEYGRIIGKNLKRIAYESGKNQAEISRDLKINKGTISSWMTGTRVPRMSKIDLLCHYFNCTRADIMEEHVFEKKMERPTRIKVYGRVAAGQPIEAIEDIIDEEEITDKMLRSGEYFGLKIHGDSMEPRMSEGDTIIVRKQDTAESGDIVVAMINGSDATCKRLRKYPHGIDLISTNPKYEPMYFSNEEIQSKPVRIIGKVVELRAKFI